MHNREISQTAVMKLFKWIKLGSMMRPINASFLFNKYSLLDILKNLIFFQLLKCTYKAVDNYVLKRTVLIQTIAHF